MRAKEFELKHRDPNWKTLQAKRTSGASGSHKDKKQAEKQGETKHKKPIDVEEAYGRPDFKVDGWTYISDVDEEEDNRKIFHTAVSPEGKRVDMDFSPYDRMDPTTFKLWLKLDKPGRQHSGPLDKEQIEKMAQIKGIAMLDPELANAGKKTEGGGFVDASNMSRRDVQRLGHEDDDTPTQYGVLINGKLWKKFATREEANRVSLAIERKHGKPTTVRSM
jgi:hypothetical protein